MATWGRSSVTAAQLNDLVERGLLPALTPAEEWRVPENEPRPVPPPGYIVSFLTFHERGIALPADDFFRGLLYCWEICLHHLNPNSIQQMAIFAALCEGYLGIELHCDLFLYFFAVNLTKKDGRCVPIGSAGMGLKKGRGNDYIPVGLTTSNKGWHFYLKNVGPKLLPSFHDIIFECHGMNWGWGPTSDSWHQFAEHRSAITRLAQLQVTGAIVMAAYNQRGVIPLMRRQLRLFQMAPGVSLVGTTAFGPPPSYLEIQRRLRDATGSTSLVFPFYFTPMRPHANALSFDDIAQGGYLISRTLQPEDADRREINRLHSEKEKKRKDAERAQKDRRAWRMLEHDKLCSRGQVVFFDTESDECPDDDDNNDGDDDNNNEGTSLGTSRVLTEKDWEDILRDTDTNVPPTQPDGTSAAQVTQAAIVVAPSPQTDATQEKGKGKARHEPTPPRSSRPTRTQPPSAGTGSGIHIS